MRRFPLFIFFLILLLIIGCGKEKQNQSDSVKDKGQTYPEGPIRMIVAYKEGGGTDIGARLLCSVAEQYLGCEIIVDNVVGADGELGYAQLCAAKPDGYTIGFINLPTFVSLPLDRKTAYSIGCIEPIMNYVFDSAVIVVRSDSPFTDFASFLSFAQANPHTLLVGNNGYKASNHIASAMLSKEFSIDLVPVPLEGSAGMIEALASGDIDLGIAKVSEVASLVKEGRFRLLASFTEERLDVFPSVPTLREQGHDCVFGSARALVAPRGTSAEILKVLQDAFAKAINDESLISTCSIWMEQN